MSEPPEISIPTLCCPGISGGADGAGAGAEVPPVGEERHTERQSTARGIGPTNPSKSFIEERAVRNDC